MPLTIEQIETIRRCSRDEAAFAEMLSLFEAQKPGIVPTGILDVQEDFICCLNPQCRLLYANRAYGSLYGRALSELVGRSLWELIPSHYVEKVRRTLEEVVTQRQKLVQEWQMLLPDGSMVTVEWTHLPLFDEEGALVGIQAVGRDITARKLAEDALQESEALLRQIVEHSQEFFYLYDPTANQVMYLSPGYEAIWQRPTTNLYSDPAAFFEAVHPEDREDFMTALPVILTSHVPVYQEYRIVRPSGEVRHIRARHYPVRGIQGAASQIVGIMQDVTEEVRAEAQRQELEREREQIRLLYYFIRDVSHEFRTPLTIISTSLHLLMHNPDTTRQMIYRDRIMNQIEVITHLLEDLQTMTRLDSSILLGHERVDAGLLLHQVVKVWQARLPQRTFLSSLPTEPLPHLVGSEDDLKIALDHLVDNAVRYSPPESPVALKACYIAPNLHISVEDKGIGIAPKDLPHIFKRFYRADVAHTTRGLGLGLCIVRRVVDLHHGMVEVDSTPEQGTTITLVLPVTSD